jgi:hypothetical protein
MTLCTGTAKRDCSGYRMMSARIFTKLRAGLSISARVFKQPSLLGLAGAMLVATQVYAVDAPTGGNAGSRAFILSNVYAATPSEPNVCSELSPGSPEIFLKSLPPDQQQSLGAPDKLMQLAAQMQAQLGFKFFQLIPRDMINADKQKRPGLVPLLIDADPDAVRIEDLRAQAGIAEGKGAIVFNRHILAYDSCTDPADFPMLNRGFHPYDGKIAYGINLDGKSGRDKFTSPTGEKNINNQLWRAIGCMKHFREFGNPENANTTLFSVATPPLIEITGIDNERNDNEVAVAIYTSADPLVADNRGRALANASFTIDPRPELIARTRGHIVDGVLITEPVDLRLRFKEQIIDNMRELRGTRIRATLKTDGSIDGGFFGYYTLDSYYDSIKQMTQLGANLSGLSCPAIHAAIQRYADGYPDPVTHRNTAISAALNFVGVAAFVIQPAVAAHTESPL